MATKTPKDAHEALQWLYEDGWNYTTVRQVCCVAEFKLRHPVNAMFSAKEEREILKLYALKGKTRG